MIGGWGCESNREIGFVSLRASEAACEREAIVLEGGGGGPKISDSCCVRRDLAVTWRLARCKDLHAVPNRLGTCIRMYPMLRGLAQLQKVAENHHFVYNYRGPYGAL